jgi:glutamate synthase domain-containing protein 2
VDAIREDLNKVIGFNRLNVEDDFDMISEERKAVLKKLGNMMKENGKLKEDSYRRQEFVQLIVLKMCQLNKCFAYKKIRVNISRQRCMSSGKFWTV